MGNGGELRARLGAGGALEGKRCALGVRGGEGLGKPVLTGGMGGVQELAEGKGRGDEGAQGGEGG